jgi:O-6-methylguanine DNA methyltransferase
MTNTLFWYQPQAPLGFLMVTVTKEGKVAQAFFADSKKEGVVEELPRGPVHIALDAYFNERQPLPVKLCAKQPGTPLQQAVWRVLRTVPLSTTITYSALAQKVGYATAVRAVASACAKNQQALFVPCHRVVSKTGNSNQYAWTPERKQWLLEYEKGE